jgi:PKD repeat protein
VITRSLRACLNALARGAVVLTTRRPLAKAGRHGAHALAAAGLVIALGIATHPGTTVAAPGLTGHLLAPAPQGWQSPANGGNGDYVFIDAPTAGSTVQGTVEISGRAGSSSTDPDGSGGGSGGFDAKAQVVIAMIDTGGNAYHVDFRDPTRLAHPSTYLTGFPAAAKAAPLCFIDGSDGAYSYNDDCQTSWQANVTADAAVVNAIAVGELVWYPGTKLMGMSFAHDDANAPVGFDQGGGSATAHGSWVSSVAVGNKFGTCPDCMLVVLEADTVEAIDAAYRWAAEQPWIDVITSSVTVGVIGAGVNPGLFPDKHAAAVKASENGKVFLTAAGNGAANFGLVPTSTYLYDGSSPAVIPVGASQDTGLASHWSDFPAEIMANGNSRGAAVAASMNGEAAVGGTSFSSPGAAGVLARSLLEARRACNDFEEGATVRGAALTLLRNNGCNVTSGPFADGTLTRDELHEAFVKNAIPPYDQRTTIPGPVTWVKNAYGYVDLGHGINNGGSTIQPLVTQSILGTRPIPVRPLEQYWYDQVVRQGQAQVWGARPVVDGDGDTYPRDDAACMPDCAPAELQRYVEGFAGLDSGESTYQGLFDLLGVSAEQFASATSTGGLAEPMPQVAGVIGEVGEIALSNDENVLTVRLALTGALDGLAPTVRSNPVSYEVTLSASHNGVVQPYRLSYEFEAVDALALLDGQVNEPLLDKFGVFVDAAANAQGLSSICPITTDLSASHFDLDTNEAVWVIPLGAFNHDNRPEACTAFTSGRALRAGDTLTGITASAVLTVGIVNFGDGFGLFAGSEAEDYTLSGDGQTEPQQISVTVNGQAAGTVTPVGGAWSLAIDFAQFAPVEGAYVVEASFGTASDSRTLQAVSAVNMPPVASLSPATAATRAGEAILFTVGGSDVDGDTLAFDLDFGDGSPHDNRSGEVGHTYATAGTYTATLTVTDSHGATDTATAVIEVEPAAPAPFSVTLSADKTGGDVSHGPLLVTFTAAVENDDGTPIQYTFAFGDGETSTVTTGESTVTHEYRYAGTYRPYVTVVQQYGARAAASGPDDAPIVTTASVSVSATASAQLAYSLPNGNVAPADVVFDTTGSSGDAWSLVFGDGGVQTGTGLPPASIAHRYHAPGSYTATLSMDDGQGNVVAQSQAITIVAVQQLTAVLQLSTSGGVSPVEVVLDGCRSIPANDGTSIVSFTMDFGDGSPTVTQVADATHVVDCNAADRSNDPSLFRHTYTATTSTVYMPTLTVTDSAATPRTAQAKSAAVSVELPAAPAGGGGGALGWLALLPLIGAGLVRRRSRAGRAPGSA